MKNIVDRVEKVDPMTVRFVLKKPEAPFIAEHGDGLRLDPVGRVRRQDDGGRHARRRSTASRSAPARSSSSRYQKDAVIRYKAFDQHWGGRPKIDNLVFAITTDASVRYAKLKTGECHVMAFPKPADVALMKSDPNINLVAAGRPERRLHRVQRREEAVRQQAGAPGAEHGDQQEGDPRSGVPGRRRRSPRTRSRRPSGPTTTRSRTIRTTRPRRRSCWRRPAIRTASRSSSGICR